MLDWMTLTIEAVGILIFCIWIVVPIREFRQILQRLRRRGAFRPSTGGEPTRRPEGRK